MPTVARLYDTFDTDPRPVVGFIRWLADRRGLSGSLRVLDIGAGTGRMVAPLTALGWHVTATEPDPDHRSRLAEVAEAEGAKVTSEAFNDLDHDAAFDLALAVNSAFAYLTTPADRVDALRRLHRALRPGGVLFLDLPNFVWILKNYRRPEEQVRQHDGHTIRLLRHHEIDYERAVFTTVEEYTVSGPDAADEKQWKRHAYAIMAPPDLIWHMEAAGFGDVETHRSYGARSPEALDGPRMLLTARRMA
jgi:SAM-dependent methyltransferase